MKSEIKTYNSESFRNEYFDSKSELNNLFKKSIKEFFCLRIEDLVKTQLKPILPSREESHFLIFITEGSYRTKIGFKEYEIKANEILIVQAGVIFSVENIISNVKGFICHFHPNTLIGKFGNRSLILEFYFLNIGHYPVIEVKSSSKSAIINILIRLVSEFQNSIKPNADIIHSYLYTLLTELKTEFGQNLAIKQNSSYAITSQFKILVNEKVKDNLKVSDFATILKISPNHLNKSVKYITSKTASEIIDEIKLIEIKYLLYQSDLSISEISYQMGYLDPSYFTRFFKKRENVSPTDFRKLIEKY